ncbi:OprO/OprP family phosphate-selective porin [bacterium]|nr:OprO/OprP family phosphate-selective porin [bacterium]
MRKLTVLAALLLLIPAVSQAKSLEDLLVEKGVITKSEARGAHHNSGAKVYWQDGSRLDFADVGFSANIYTMFRTRYEFNDVDNDINPGASNESSFDVTNARLGVTGSALHKEFDYMMEVEFADGTATLLDAYIKWNTCDWGGIQMGQFRPDISRGFNTRIAHLQFADRSAVTDFFAFQRNQGVKVDVALNDDWTVAAAAFNGNSDGEGLNSEGQDTKHLGVVSLRGDIMGEMNHLIEGDVDHTEDTAVNVGAAVGFAENELAFAGGSVDEMVVSADINVKSEGFSFHGEYYYLEHDIDGGMAIDTTGFYAQAGYFLEPKEWEVAVRYGYIDCDDGAGIGNDVTGGINNGGVGACTGADDVNSVDVGVNYYWWKHNLKAQFGYSLVNQDLAAPVNGEDDSQDNRWIFQLSSYF